MGRVIKTRNRYAFLSVSRELAEEIITNDSVNIDVYDLSGDNSEYLISNVNDISDNDELVIELGFDNQDANYWHLLTLVTGLTLIAEKNYERKGENL